MIAPWHDDPTHVARAILAEPQFRDAAAGAPSPWWLPLAHWLRDVLAKLFAPLGRLHPSSAVSDAVALALVALIVVAAVVLLRRLARRITWRRRESFEDAVAVAADRGPGSSALHAEALLAFRDGRHREAATLLWRAALRLVDERGRVRYDPARTPAEWRNAVNDPAFDVLARGVVLALFANRADAALFERMRDAYSRLTA